MLERAWMFPPGASLFSSLSVSVPSSAPSRAFRLSPTSVWTVWICLATFLLLPFLGQTHLSTSKSGEVVLYLTTCINNGLLESYRFLMCFSNYNFKYWIFYAEETVMNKENKDKNFVNIRELPAFSRPRPCAHTAVLTDIQWTSFSGWVTFMLPYFWLLITWIKCYFHIKSYQHFCYSLTETTVRVKNKWEFDLAQANRRLSSHGSALTIV